MYQVDEKPETIHLYIVREEPRPSVLPIVASILMLLCVIAVGTIFPYQQPLERQTLRIPAIFLPLTTFTATTPIISTGIKTYPATQAHGVLTVYNGSIFQQEIPSGMIVNAQGIEVVVDTSVIVPAGNPPNFGIATVLAHAVIAGAQGNIAAFAINQVYGASVYIRNLSAFHGGSNATTTQYVTQQDMQSALDSARTSLTSQEAHRHSMLAKPCYESSQVKNTFVRLFWTCQYVTYTVSPSMHVLHATLTGNFLIVDVVFVARQKRIETK